MCCLHGARFDLVQRTGFDFWFLDCDLGSKTEGLRTRFNRGVDVVKKKQALMMAGDNNYCDLGYPDVMMIV